VAGSDGECAVLDALERLELARARLRGGGHALYALPRAELDASDLSSDTRSFELFPEPDSARRSPSSLPHLSGTPHS
jgi:hypothetical protein